MQPWCFANGTCGSQGPRGAGNRTDATIETNMKRALAIVDAAGAKGADVVQLPEEFKYSWVTTDRAECPFSVCAEPLRGSTYQLLAAKAKQYSMHIIYGTRENATEDGAIYNTAVVLDRKGEIAVSIFVALPSGLSTGNCVISVDFCVFDGNSRE